MSDVAFRASSYMLPVLEVTRDHPAEVAADMRAVLRLFYPKIASKVSYRTSDWGWGRRFDVRLDELDRQVVADVKETLRPLMRGLQDYKLFIMELRE